MEYYIVNNGKAEGPYTKEQLAENKITPETFVWHEGLESWVEAEKVESLKDILATTESDITETSSQEQGTEVADSEPMDKEKPASTSIEGTEAMPPMPLPGRAGMTAPVYHTTSETCPANHLTMSIVSAFFFPTGIAAIVKSALVNTRWSQGRKDDAKWLSQSAKMFAILSFILGGIFYLLYFLFYITLIFG